MIQVNSLLLKIEFPAQNNSVNNWFKHLKSEFGEKFKNLNFKFYTNTNWIVV